VTLAARYVGSRFNDIQNRQSQKAFDVWTLAASYDVTKWIQLYSRAENLFDERYEEILNAGTAG
jgi:vitamin B12 transporter